MAPTPAPMLAPSNFKNVAGSEERFYGKAAEALGQAEEAFQRGYYQEALKKYTETQQHHGKPSAVTKNEIGLSYMGLGKNEAAIPHLSTAIEIEDNALHRSNRGTAYAMTGQCDKASEDARAALAMDPIKEDGFHTDVEANFILARCHAQNGNHLPALQHAETTLEMARTHGYPETYLEEVATTSLAIQAVLEGKSGPEDLIFEPALTHSQTGIELHNQGDYEAALVSFRTAQEMHGPPSGDIQAWIGYTYSAMGQNQNAINHYTEAIGIRDSALRRINRGGKYTANGQCTEAAADAEAALGMKAYAEPGSHTDVEAHRILAFCLLDKGDNQNALFHIDKAISAARTNGYPAEDISEMSKFRENAQATG